MLKSLIKKFVISKINNTLKNYKDDIAKVSDVIDTWIVRLSKVIEQLGKINERVKDGEITESELNDSQEEIEELIKGF